MKDESLVERGQALLSSGMCAFSLGRSIVVPLFDGSCLRALKFRNVCREQSRAIVHKKKNVMVFIENFKLVSVKNIQSVMCFNNSDIFRTLRVLKHSENR